MDRKPAEKKRTVTRMDLLLILILFAAAGCLLFFRHRQGAGSLVRIYSDNEIVKELSLNRDDSFTITTDLGTNTIVVENGQAFMADADCPDKICEQMGLISKPGEMIICLPHKIIVEVSDGK